MSGTVSSENGKAAAKAQALILVVEDEILIRMAAVADLREAGFETVEAADADEALLILQARADIGVLFTDVSMPGRMNGAELAVVVQRQWPAIRIIVTSGVTDGLCCGEPNGKVYEFLPKPYDISVLIDMLQTRASCSRVA